MPPPRPFPQSTNYIHYYQPSPGTPKLLLAEAHGTAPLSQLQGRETERDKRDTERHRDRGQKGTPPPPAGQSSKLQGRRSNHEPRFKCLASCSPGSRTFLFFLSFSRGNNSTTRVGFRWMGKLGRVSPSPCRRWRRREPAAVSVSMCVCSVLRARARARVARAEALPAAAAPTSGRVPAVESVRQAQQHQAAAAADHYVSRLSNSCLDAGEQCALPVGSSVAVCGCSCATNVQTITVHYYRCRCSRDP
jgi:hypothetical protein